LHLNYLLAKYPGYLAILEQITTKRSFCMTERVDFDTPWKAVLETYFQPFMEICYPAVAKEIDWSRGYEFLDQELSRITRDAEIGNGTVDKLIKVWCLNGKEAWVLMHIEIQGQWTAHFTQRMFIYYYRIFDQYKVPILSLALMIDDNPHWPPAYYEQSQWGCKLRFDFVRIKLLDYEAQREALSVSNNPFAVVILIYLDTLKMGKDAEERFVTKMNLTRKFYEKGWDKTKVLHLYHFIDYLVVLPKPLELKYLTEINHLEQEKKMPYISSAERFGEERGREEGLKLGIAEGLEKGVAQGLELGVEQGLEQGLAKGVELGHREGEKKMLLLQIRHKFGNIPQHYLKQIETFNSEEILVLAERLLGAKTLPELFDAIIV
jgi:predicted transposase YdaD